MFPAAIYVQRGKSNFEELLQSAEHVEARILLIIGEREGNPGSFELYSMRNAVEPVFSLEVDGVRLAREYGVPVRIRSEGITFSSDSNKTSKSLRKLFESHFENDAHSRNPPTEGEVRVLSIIGIGNERVRLTFKVSKTGLDLGPSITGSLKTK